MSKTNSTQNPPLWYAIGGVSLIVVLLVTRSLMQQPQMGPDEEVFKTVDALFTAVTSKDKQRLHDCQVRLETFRSGGTLPASAARTLDSIVKQADSGQWDRSARALYDFMLAQRRAS